MGCHTRAQAPVYSRPLRGLATLILPPAGESHPARRQLGGGVCLPLEPAQPCDKGQGGKPLIICRIFSGRKAKNSSEESGRLRPLPSFHRIDHRLEDRALLESNPSARTIRGISPGPDGKPSGPLFWPVSGLLSHEKGRNEE